MARNKESILAGLVLITGAIIGAAGTLLYKESQPKNPGNVLQEIKKHMAQEGKIEGSWIDYDAVEYHIFDSRPLVYMGGLTINHQGETRIYHFAADIYSGDIIDIFQVKN